MAMPSLGGQASAQDVYLEKDGLLVLEAEAADVPSNHWQVESAVAGASGGTYLRAKTNSFGTPGMGIIDYHFETTTTGTFQFNYRTRIGQGSSSTDHNDTWVRLVDDNSNPVVPVVNNNDIRTGQWMKAYRNGDITQWISQASNLDNVGRSISWSLEEGMRYSLQISSRSAGHLVDRLYLWDKSQYNFADKDRGFGANENALNAFGNSQLVPEPGTAVLTLGVVGAVLLGRRRFGTSA
ncbi:hypothetical protein HNQ40_000078 [Algisphaera agarilytica]|uniref:PEP-CTERM protein-sorting domain-containing protein n=2 Tax=Algisphaera agarilytica TaxID=1385975 RepID=A0A7X0H397_9BACT|nr:hypothetical protein [Algisphaera agarilytica]